MVKNCLKVAFCLMICMTLVSCVAHQKGQYKASCVTPELSVDAVKAGKVSASYATVKGGKIAFSKKPTAYSPETLNGILNAYGAALSGEGVGIAQKASKAYASMKGGKIVFGKKPTAYSPETLNTILNAYELTFPPESAEKMTDPPNYAKAKGGKVVFGKKPTAYSPEEFDMLLSAYCLPAEPGAPAPVAPAPAVTPTPAPARTPDACPDADGDDVCDDQDVCPNTPKGAIVKARGCWIIENLLFDYDKSFIRPQYFDDLDKVVDVLKANPGLTVEIQGHTDNIGSKRYNKPLSERRAKAVVDYLIKKGISVSRLSSIGYWFSKPAASNDTPEGRQMNRRVELKPIQ